jgi:drug/metabolite transporter (DMT)-like permease
MNPILLLLLGSIALGFAETLNGSYMKKYEKITSVGLIIVGTTIGLVLSIIVIIFSKEPLYIPSYNSIALIIISGILFYIANKAFYNTFKLQEASTSTIVCLSTIIVTTLFGKIVFNENVALMQWFGVLLVVLAVILVNLGSVSISRLKDVFKLTPANKMVLFAAFFYGIANGLNKLIVQDISPIYYQLLGILLVTPFTFLFDRKEVKEQLIVLKNTKAYHLLALAIPFYFIYNLIRSIVFEKGLALPLADSIDNVVIFVIIALEWSIFKIRPNDIIFKIVTAVLAFVGVLLMSYAK